MQRSWEEVSRDRGPPLLRERRVVGRVQRLEREGQVFQFVLWRVSRIPRSLVAEEVLSTPRPRVQGLLSVTVENGRLRSGGHIPVHIQVVTTACYCDWASLHLRAGVPKDGMPTDLDLPSLNSRVPWGADVHASSWTPSSVSLHVHPHHPHPSPSRGKRGWGGKAGPHIR